MRSTPALAGPLLLALAAGATGCATAHVGASGATTARLLLRCPLADATVWLDDRFIGEIDEARGGIRLRAGRHRLEFRHEGYLTSYHELELASGTTRTIECVLSEDLTGGR